MCESYSKPKVGRFVRHGVIEGTPTIPQLTSGSVQSCRNAARDRQTHTHTDTDTQTAVTSIHFASAIRLTQNVKNDGKSDGQRGSSELPRCRMGEADMPALVNPLYVSDCTSRQSRISHLSCLSLSFGYITSLHKRRSLLTSSLSQPRRSITNRRIAM